MTTQANIAHKVGIADSDALAGSLAGRVTDYLHTVARMKLDGSGRNGSAHLRSFSIHQDGNTVGDGTRVIDELVQPLKIQVRSVETDDVHPRLEELAYEIHLATLVGDGGYNLSLFQ